MLDTPFFRSAASAAFLVSFSPPRKNIPHDYRITTRIFHSNQQQEQQQDDKKSSVVREDGISRRVALSTAAAATTGLVAPFFVTRKRAVAAAAENVVATTMQATTATTTTTVPTMRLGGPASTLTVSRTIQGYWQLAGGHGRYTESDAIANMKAHYDAGITTLDTADIYGPSELIVGKFTGQYKSSSSSSKPKQQQPPRPIPCTKFCCFRFLEEINRAEVKSRIQKACERLQVDKLPLVAFFWGNYDVKRYVDVGLMLTELKEEGLIQEIGATNFDLKRLKEMKEAGIPLVSHQVQLSALDRRPVQSGMADWCAANDVSLIGFGTVGSGILTNLYLGRDTPPTVEERNTASLRMYSATASRFGDWGQVQELLRTMDAIAKNVRDDGRCAQANISNIAQRHVLQTPSVASVLIGVRNRDHLQENVRTHSFVLRQDEMDAIDAVIAKRKGPKGDVWDLERGTI